MGGFFDITAPIGEMRWRIQIQHQDPTRDEYGAEIAGDWQNVDMVWAKVEPLGGRELALAHEVYPESDYRFTIRYSPDLKLDQSMRILFNGDQFDIADITNVESRNRLLIITATKRPTGRNA